AELRAAGLLLAPTPKYVEPADDESLLRSAGVSSDGPSLLAFFQARTRTQIDAAPLDRLLQQFRDGSAAQRDRAAGELVGLGALALPAMRQLANDIDCPDVAKRAARCLPWLEGPSSHKLLMAAARLLGRRKAEGAAAVLLAYLPHAEDAEIIAAVEDALSQVAAPDGKPAAALLQGMADRQGIRRAAAAAALSRAVSPQRVPEVRKLLKDPSPTVRLRTALALAQANDAEAIAVLIDLLAEVSAEKRQPIEEFLKQLAGEWALTVEIPIEDAIGRRIRRDAWATWWRLRDGAMLLAEIGKHTLTPDKSRKIESLIAKLGNDEFDVREEASRQLRTFGRLVLPQLHQARKHPDAETARRAKVLIEDIERAEDARLPLAALRLLAVRKPAGAVEALLAYLPFADDEMREDEVRKSLIVLARSEGERGRVSAPREGWFATLRRSLTNEQALVRAVAAEVLIQGGGAEGRAAVRKLLTDDVPAVRLRAALTLARVGERQGIALLIDLLPRLSAEESGQAEEILYALAGDTAPKMPEGAEADDVKKRHDAWAAWWKINAKRVDLRAASIAGTVRPMLGYTLICDGNRVFEVDRHGKERW
ncbi:MAG: HEAT repeat domain-containing protein, partial [Gemmataceae bacterium]